MKLHLKKNCGTCEFNFRGICGGGRYNCKIDDLESSCDQWDASPAYFEELLRAAPWYIKEKYSHSKISWLEFIQLIEKDEQNIPIPLNIYDLIERIYKLLCPEQIAEALNVSPSVVSYAHSRGTPEKRICNFANKLQIPMRYFQEVFTTDIPEIEKCKERFYKLHNGSIDYIKCAANERSEQQWKAKVKPAYPDRKRAIDTKIAEYRQYKKLYHDMSDDYNGRDYVIAIRLQKSEYFGHMYYEYHSSGYGIQIVMSDILSWIEDLDTVTIDEFNTECLLVNDINLTTDEKGNILFTLCNDAGQGMEVTTQADQLENYIVGYNMIRCEGHGKKKESRKCIDCKYFTPSHTSAKGFCSIRQENVPRSRIICAFDFESV